MKLSSLNFLELESFCKQAQGLVGGRIQDVWTSDRGVGFFIWTPERGVWLWLDLIAICPLPVFLDLKKIPIRKVVKPLGLFVKSHILGQRVNRFYCEKDKGRILYMEGSHFNLEIRLFPHGQNVIVQANSKNISWHPVKELGRVLKVNDDFEMRDLERMGGVWLESLRSSKGEGLKKNPLKKLKHDLVKKERALDKMRKSLREKESEDWFVLGTKLKEIQSLDVGGKWEGYLNTQESLSFNIERCFQKHKDQKRKIEGTKNRVIILEKEIESFKQKVDKFDSSVLANKNKEVVAPSSLLYQAKAKGRKLSLDRGKEAVVGKSAHDNLAILRKSKPWFLWVHIKDSPGAYGVISCNRKQLVTEQEIVQVCRWLLKESQEKGQGKFDFLVAECRYVNPIKGDRLGRVTYKNERVLAVDFIDNKK